MEIRFVDDIPGPLLIEHSQPTGPQDTSELAMAIEGNEFGYALNKHIRPHVEAVEIEIEDDQQ